MTIINDKPIWLSVPTIRDYDQYVRESARVEGWNQAMEYIFGERIRHCWMLKNNGDWLCQTCQNREKCVARRIDREVVGRGGR